MSDGARARENPRQVKAGPPAGPSEARRPEGAAAAPGRWTARRPLEAAAQLCQRKIHREPEGAGARAEAPTGGGVGGGGGAGGRAAGPRAAWRGPSAPAGRGGRSAPGVSLRRRRPAVRRTCGARQLQGVKGKWPGGGTAGAQVPRRAGPLARPPRASRAPARRALMRTRPRARPGPGREPAAGPGGARRPRGDLNFAGPKRPRRDG